MNKTQARNTALAAARTTAQVDVVRTYLTVAADARSSMQRQHIAFIESLGSGASLSTDQLLLIAKVRHRQAAAVVAADDLHAALLAWHESSAQ